MGKKTSTKIKDNSTMHLTLREKLTANYILLHGVYGNILIIAAIIFFGYFLNKVIPVWIAYGNRATASVLLIIFLTGLITTGLIFLGISINRYQIDIPWQSYERFVEVIHVNNPQYYAIETYKSKNGMTMGVLHYKDENGKLLHSPNCFISYQFNFDPDTSNTKLNIEASFGKLTQLGRLFSIKAGFWYSNHLKEGTIVITKTINSKGVFNHEKLISKIQ